MTLEPRMEKAAENAEKPDLAVAMELARYVKEELQQLESRIDEQMRQVSNANALTVKRMGEIESAFDLLKKDLQHTRIERADKEVREAEARLRIARDHKDGLSTQEKIEVNKAVEDRLSADQKARAEKRRAFWDKVIPGVTTALIISIVAPVGLGLFIVVLAFILRALGIEVQLPT